MCHPDWLIIDGHLTLKTSLCIRYLWSLPNFFGTIRLCVLNVRRVVVYDQRVAVVGCLAYCSCCIQIHVFLPIDCRNKTGTCNEFRATPPFPWKPIQEACSWWSEIRWRTLSCEFLFFAPAVGCPKWMEVAFFSGWKPMKKGVYGNLHTGYKLLDTSSITHRIHVCYIW